MKPTELAAENSIENAATEIPRNESVEEIINQTRSYKWGDYDNISF